MPADSYFEHSWPSQPDLVRSNVKPAPNAIARDLYSGVSATSFFDSPRAGSINSTAVPFLAVTAASALDPDQVGAPTMFPLSRTSDARADTGALASAAKHASSAALSAAAAPGSCLLNLTIHPHHQPSSRSKGAACVVGWSIAHLAVAGIAGTSAVPTLYDQPRSEDPQKTRGLGLIRLDSL
jgi:hypothetical protein